MNINFFNGPIPAPEYKQLLELTPGKYGYNAITYEICENQDFDKARSMIDHYQGIGNLDNHGRSIIHWAAFFFDFNQNTSFQIMEKCLNHGVSINTQSSDGSTPLHFLVHSNTKVDEGLLKMVRIMIKAGADPTIKNDEGVSAIANVITNSALSNEGKLKLINQMLMYLPYKTRKQEIHQLLLLPFTNTLIDQVDSELVMNMIQNFSDYININEVATPEGTPLLAKVIDQKYSIYDGKEIIDIAETLLKCGANVDVRDFEGNHIIYHFLLNNMYSDKSKLKLLKIFINYGLTVDLMIIGQFGPTSVICCCFDNNWSLEEQEEVLTSLYGSNVYQELLYRRLLVNSFYLENYRTQICGEEIEIDGAISITKFTTPLLNKNSKFFKNLVADIDNPKDSAIWSRVTSMIDNDAINILNSLPSQKIDKLKKALLKVPKLQKHGITAEKLSAKKILGILKNANKKRALFISHRGGSNDPSHIVGYYSHKNYFLIGNRGYACGAVPGVSIHEKNSIHCMEELSKDLSMRLEAKDFMFKHFPERLQENEVQSTNNIIRQLEQTSQRGGNCPMASFNSLELAILYMQIREVIDNSQAAEQIARAIKKTHTSSRREELLRDYLEAHSYIDSPPHDKNLLYAIANHTTSDYYIDFDRYDLITKWAEQNDRELFDLLYYSELDDGFIEVPKTPTCEWEDNTFSIEPLGQSSSLLSSTQDNDMVLFDEDDDFEVPKTPTCEFDDDFFPETQVDQSFTFEGSFFDTPPYEVPKTPDAYLSNSDNFDF